MKRKVFSLMMTLLLAFMGVAKAETIVIGDGTGTSYYAPFNSLYEYSFVEQVYTASEIGGGGTITAISFNMRESDATQTNAVDVFMKNVSRSTFSSSTDYEPVTASDMVFSGTVTFSPGWTTITLDTPFAYDGSSNLMIGMHEYTPGYSTRYFYYTDVESSILCYYSDSYNPDPYDLGSYSGTKFATYRRANIQIEMTSGGGGGEIVEVLIGDPTSTTTNSYLPTYSLYDYSFTQQIYTADEIGVGGTVNALTMWLKNTSSYARNLNVYMKEVSESAFASGSAWVSMTAGDLVASGTLANGITNPVETTFTFSSPFEYSGNGNLVVCVQDVTGSWSSGAAGVTMPANGSQAIYAYRDNTVYDPTNPGVTGTTLTVKNVVRLNITTEGGGPVGDALVALQDGEVVETVVVGARPNGCWMEPFRFTLRNDGPATNVSLIDFTPQEYFTVVEPEMPFHMAHNEEVEVALATGTSANTAWQMVALYGEGRTARIWDIVAEPYDPAVPDVWELACEEATTFPFVEVPATAHNTVLHNDYTLPFPEIAEGNDAVYKLVFTEDQMINAAVTYGNNGKVALYT
ncbi:MAG: hypothetical protein IKH44_07270, partial [Bacteroidales bacterium]|nr:hypothetical protein [Bacteroidales bacterium]